MSFDLSSITSQVGAMLPSSTQIMDNLLLGAATSVVVKGLQAGGANSLDPLGLFPHPQQQQGAPMAATNNPAVTSGPTITASAFAALSPGDKATMLSAGTHIVAG